MNYIYMSDDNMGEVITNRHTKVFLKVGYSKQPQYRGCQLHSQARTMHGINIPKRTFVTEAHAIPLNTTDKALTLFVERYVLQKAMHMGSASPCKGCKEYLRMSLADRDRCHALLPVWVQQGILIFQLKKLGA